MRPDGPGHVLRPGRGGQHGLHAQGRPAVQRATRGAQAGGHHRVGVGAHGRGHPGGERGRGQFMVGQQHERGAQGSLAPVVW